METEDQAESQEFPMFNTEFQYQDIKRPIDKEGINAENMNHWTVTTLDQTPKMIQTV